jgi:hypothetical protein
MKKILAAIVVCVLSLASMTSTASAKDRLSLDEARDLIQLGKQGLNGVKKFRNGVDRFNDGIGAVQDRVNGVKNIGKVFRRR